MRVVEALAERQRLDVEHCDILHRRDRVPRDHEEPIIESEAHSGAPKSPRPSSD